MIKPDAMTRGLAGEIISRIEKVGLRMVKAQLIQATEEITEKHYPLTEEWLQKVGKNTLSDCQKYGLDVQQTMGTADPMEIGKLVHQWNKGYLTSHPVLAVVFEGVHAVEVIRKLCGPTLPLLAPAGTIRGDLSSVSAISENTEKMPIRNLVHASGTPEEALREIEIWFGKE